jgi:hypothetical protein
MIMAFTIADRAITAIRTLTDPDRLAQVVPRGSRNHGRLRSPAIGYPQLSDLRFYS